MKNNMYTITNFNEYELYHLKAEIDTLNTELLDSINEYDLKAEIDSLNTELLNSMKYLETTQPEYYETQDTIETLEKVILLLDELVTQDTIETLEKVILLLDELVHLQ